MEMGFVSKMRYTVVPTQRAVPMISKPPRMMVLVSTILVRAVSLKKRVITLPRQQLRTIAPANLNPVRAACMSSLVIMTPQRQLQLTKRASLERAQGAQTPRRATIIQRLPKMMARVSLFLKSTYS